jgi:anti-sigma regulatory factor (Ser/Thr protein kinase)
MVRQALILEEASAIGSLLRRAVRASGVQPMLLASADLALRWARDHRPAMVLLGRPGPRHSAEELCQALKLGPATLVTQVLRLGSASLEPRTALEVQPDEYLSRSATEEEVRTAVKRALARASDRERRGVRAEVCMRLRSDSCHLEPLTQLLSNLLAAAGLGEPQCQRLTLAVRELGANAIEWGHQNQPHRPVTICCRLDAEEVSVLVRDTGPGFNRHDLPHAAKEDDPLSHLTVRAARNLREGGFGILLAKGLVDELRYNDVGNEARLILHLNGARTLKASGKTARAGLPSVKVS